LIIKKEEAPQNSEVPRSNFQAAVLFDSFSAYKALVIL